MRAVTRISPFRPWAKGGREESFTLRSKINSVFCVPVYITSLWGCGYFQLVLALVHTAEYSPSFHSCTCQNRSLWSVSCYYGNFIVTEVHIVSFNEDTYVLYWWLWYSSFWPPFWAQTGEERLPDSNQWRGKNQSELIQNQVVEINCMNCTKMQ